MKVSLPKSSLWTTSAVQNRRWKLGMRSGNIQQVDCLRILGCWFRLRGLSQQDSNFYKAAVDTCRARAKRIAVLPVSAYVKSLLTACMILPKFLCMPLGNWITKQDERTIMMASYSAVGSGKPQCEGGKGDSVRAISTTTPASSRVRTHSAACHAPPAELPVLTQKR